MQEVMICSVMCANFSPSQLPTSASFYLVDALLLFYEAEERLVGAKKIIDDGVNDNIVKKAPLAH
jgi:hypothetical protein